MVSTFSETTSAVLTLTTGYSLGLAPGSARVVTDIEGWHKGAPLRRAKTERLNAHGSFAVRGFKDERLVSVSGAFLGSSRADAAAFVDEINAFIADGSEGELVVDDVDFGVRRAEVYLLEPDVVWTGGAEVRFTLDMVAPDPRLYGEKLSVSTGVPVDGGGLRFDLFGGDFTVSRTNRLVNPSFEVNTAGWASIYTLARDLTVAHVGTASAKVTATSDGNRSIHGTAQASPGEVLAVSAYFRHDGAASRTVRVDYAFEDSSNVRIGNYMAGPGLAASAGGFIRATTITAAAPAGTAFIRVYPVALSMLAAETLWVDAAMVEASESVGAYFDGSTAPADGKAYAWTGAAHSSTSTESVPVEGSAYGVLDFGAVGDPGTVAFANVGKADVGTVFRVDGYAPGFTITEVGSGSRLVYSGTVPAGNFLLLDGETGAVYLNGDLQADRSDLLTVREWTRVEGGETAVFQFESAGPNARLTLEAVPAWW